jgi:transcriptional regulator with XRE-family HTH domain
VERQASNGLDVTFSTQLGAGLRLAREARHLSQDDVARLAGVSRKQVSLLEAGHHLPTLRTLLRLLDALGVGSLEQVATGLVLTLLQAEPVGPGLDRDGSNHSDAVIEPSRMPRHSTT